MEDNQIVELFFDRKEEALIESSDKYGKYLRTVISGILPSNEDAHECLNDTLLKAWNCIPPQKPANLKAFLAKIARNTALDYYEKAHAQKRGKGTIAQTFDELGEIVRENDVQVSEEGLSSLINDFLAGLEPVKRKMFVKRYFYFESIRDIARELVLSESCVKTSLCRIREMLKTELEKEGFNI